MLHTLAETRRTYTKTVLPAVDAHIGPLAVSAWRLLEPQATVPTHSVGREVMDHDAASPATHRMPVAAMTSALETFASLTRSRHPGVCLLPLRRIGTNGPVVAAATGQVIRPFAAPEDDDALLDRDARVAAPDDHRID